MSNINRDYMVIIDVKSGSVNKPTMVFYNTDKNTSNIYAQLVVKETIVNATPIENATDFAIELKVVKPGNVVKFMDGVLVNEEQAIYEFDLPEDFTNLSGNYDIEFWVKAKVNNRDEIITSSKAKYTVKPSILTDLDEAIEDHEDYPLFLKLMEQVKTLNEKSMEAYNVLIPAKEAEEQRKANEAVRAEAEANRRTNEAARVGQEATRVGQEATRVANENERKASENQRKANEEVRATNEVERKANEASRVAAENTRAANEEIRQTNEANREAAEKIRKANEEARISEHEAMRTEHDQTMTTVNEVKAENAVLMENDKKLADRMTQVEISDKRQYVIMEGLMNSAGDGYLKIEDTGNDTTLYNSVEGFVDVKNITGNTMVNSIKNPDDEFTLNGDINTSGQSVTLTTAVDNGQVDVLAEGNTMVNVCDQQEPVAITKSYTVETGNHIALQGEFDGKARPVPTGNTLWIDNDTGEVLTAFDDTKNLRLQSSFEDKVVTQEMVDNGEELAENLGKYRVDYKVTGKNKFDGVWYDGWLNNGDVTWSNKYVYSNYIKVKPGSTVSFSTNLTVAQYDKNLIFIKSSSASSKTLDSNCYYIRVCIRTTDHSFILQIEEGDTATTYEPHKSFTKTYYLNSPLLEGDTIEESNGNVYHVHRYGKVVLNGSSDENWSLSNSNPNTLGTYFTLSNASISKGDSTTFRSQLSDKLIAGVNPYSEEGDNVIGVVGTQVRLRKSDLTTVDELKSWLQSKPVTVVYQLASPTYELISANDTILTDSYVAGHLDFDTAIPVEKVVFKICNNMTLKYIYASTDYTIQFESDNVGKVKFYLTSWRPYIDVVKGINKFNLTTTNDINLLGIEGIGFNMSNIVVTEATDKDFGYFSGMKSVGELEENKIEILSRNNNMINKNDLLDTTKWSRDTYWSYPIKVKPNTNYTISVTFTRDDNVWLGIFGVPNVYKDMISPILWNLNGKQDDIVTGTINTGDRNIIYISIYDVSPNTVFGENGKLKNIYFGETSYYTDYIENKSNKKQILLNEPLRAVGNTKDRFVQIDGKWYVERNCKSIILTDTTLPNDIPFLEPNRAEGYTVFPLYFPDIGMPNTISNSTEILCNNFIFKANAYNSRSEGQWVCTNAGIYLIFSLPNTVLKSLDRNGFIEWIKNNPIEIIYPIESQTYEEITDPQVITYLDTTHISNNSTIPMNMNIKNSGYEVIVKPSTKYTVVGMTNGRIGNSTIVNGTITTPATLDDPFLRPYGSGKVSKVMLLEGEPTNIPGYFKGIKSVFEDQLITEGENAGKYKCEVKVVGKNKISKIIPNKYQNYSSTNTNIVDNNKCAITDFIPVVPGKTYIGTGLNSGGLFYDKFKEPFVPANVDLRKPFTVPEVAYYLVANLWANPTGEGNIQIEEGSVATEYEPYHETKQTLYLDEPLYNTNNITIYNDKLGYWKNWGKVVFDGSEDEFWDKIPLTIDGLKNYSAFQTKLNPQGVSTSLNDTTYIDDRGFCNFINNSVNSSAKLGRALARHSNGNLYLRIESSALTSNDTAGFRQYLSENPVTVVYQLAEPVFVPLIDNCPNWVIGSWDNCSIHFDSIIPLSATRYRYTGNVPSVVAMSDDVATTRSISDEQDNLIVDLATQVAVLEMMTL